MPQALGIVLIPALGLTLGHALFIAGAFFYLATRPKLTLSELQGGRANSTIRAAITSAKWRIGIARHYGVLTWLGYKDKYMSFCLVLGEAPITRLHKVWVGGRELDTSQLTGHGATQKWRASDAAGADGSENPDDALTITLYTNGAAQSINPQEADSYNAGLAWDRDTFQMQGLAFVIVRLRNADDIAQRWWQGIPEIEFLTEGLRYQPSGQAAAATIWNAAHVRYWWEREREGESADRIDQVSYLAAVSICEDKGYRIEGTIEADDDYPSIRSAFNLAWDGAVVEWAGKLRFWPGSERAPVTTVGEADVLELPTIRPAPELSQRYNTITASVQVLAEAQFSPYSFPPWKRSAIVTRDGGELTLDLGNLEYIQRKQHVQRLMQSVLLDQAGAQITVRVPYGTTDSPYRYLALAPGEVVRLNLPIAGIQASRRWRIIESVPSEGLTLSLTLLEEVAGRYPTKIDDVTIEEVPAPLFAPIPLPTNVRMYGTQNSLRVEYKSKLVGPGTGVYWEIQDSSNVRLTSRQRSLSGLNADDTQRDTISLSTSLWLRISKLALYIFRFRSDGSVPPTGSPLHERTANTVVRWG